MLKTFHEGGRNRSYLRYLRTIIHTFTQTQTYFPRLYHFARSTVRFFRSKTEYLIPLRHDYKTTNKIALGSVRANVSEVQPNAKTHKLSPLVTVLWLLQLDSTHQTMNTSAWYSPPQVLALLRCFANCIIESVQLFCVCCCLGGVGYSVNHLWMRQA